MKEFEFHPISEVFPLMSAQEIKELAEDIKERGLLTPITLFENKILDGRHRYEACMQAKVSMRFVQYHGKDPIGFVLSCNVHRRHLTASQRAIAAAEAADLKWGEAGLKSMQVVDRAQAAPVQYGKPTHAEAAKIVQVSKRSMNRASKVLDESPKLAEDVRNGKITLKQAEQALSEAKAAKEVHTDTIGREIPEDVWPDWKRAAEVASRLRSRASEIKVTVERGLADKDLIFAEIHNPTIAEAAGLHYTLSQIAPYVICPVCQGKVRKTCQLCRRRGWISKFLYNSPAVSSDTRALLEKVARK